MNRLISLLLVGSGLVVFPLADYALKGTIVLLLTGSVCLMLRRDSAATRHFVWMIAVCLLIVMPVLSLVLPEWRVLPSWMHSGKPAVVATTATVATTGASSPEAIAAQDFDLRPLILDDAPASGMRQLPGTTSAQRPHSLPAAASYRPADTGRSPIPWTTWMSGIWFFGCVVHVVRLLAAAALLRRAARRSVIVASVFGERLGVTDVETQRLQTGLIHAMSLLGVRRPIQLLLDPQRSIPIVWGLLKTRLQLPAEAVQWTDEQLQSVLLHELAHVRRRDLFVLAITQFACALHWFNPLVWIAAWRMHIERERACDDLVLVSGVRASAYAEHLLNVATRLSSSKWTQACGLAMARSSSLHGRLTAVLNAKTNRRRVTKTIALIALLVSCVVAVPIVILQAANSQPDEKKVNAANKEDAAGDRHEPFQKILGTDVLKLTWDDIDLHRILGVETLPEDVKQALPGWLTALEGKKVRIRGVMCPTWEATGLTEFALDRHARFMNFARMTQLDQIIRIRLAAGTTTDYIETRFFDVEGTFRIEPKVEGNDLTELYRIENAQIVLSPAPVANVIRGRLLKPNNTPAVGFLMSANDGVNRFEIVTKSPGYKLPAERSQQAMENTTRRLNSATRGGEYDLGNGCVLKIDTRNETKQSFSVIWKETSESSAYRLNVVPKPEEGTSADIARMRMTPKSPVPAGVGRPTIGWSIVWEQGSSNLWLAESGLISKLEISDPEQVVWTKYDRSGSYSSPEIPNEIRQRFHSFDVYKSILRRSIWPRNIEDNKKPATIQTLTATKVTR